MQTMSWTHLNQMFHIFALRSEKSEYFSTHTNIMSFSWVPFDAAPNTTGNGRKNVRKQTSETQGVKQANRIL